MGHELMLVIAAVVIIVTELLVSDKNKGIVVPIAIALLFITMALTIAFPAEGRIFAECM